MFFQYRFHSQTFIGKVWGCFCQCTMLFFLNGKTSEMRQLGKCRSNVMWKLNLTFSNICACCNHNKTVGRILWSPDWKCYRYKNIFCTREIFFFKKMMLWRVVIQEPNDPWFFNCILSLLFKDFLCWLSIFWCFM